jgi:protease-4
MSVSTADYLVDRRRLRRSVTLWRVLAFAGVFVALLGFAASFSGSFNLNTARPHIARLAIEGLITGDKTTIKLIDDIAESKAAAVIVTLESPGGTTTGSEKIYDALRRLSAKKPVVGVVGNMAASGAYIAALGTDRIFAKGNSLVGSIGVLFQFPNVSKLLDTIGVKVEEVKSSPLKAAPNGFEPTSPEARAALAALVSDSFDWFKGLVKERRAMSDDELAKVADGRVFTGRQAIGNKLIDAIGDEKEAIAWLESQKGIAKGLPVIDWKKTPGLERLGLLGAASAVASAFGLEGLSGALLHQAQSGEARMLDGLVSIWQIQ